MGILQCACSCSAPQCVGGEVSQMFVTIKTIVSFDPVKEYEKIQAFEEQHDMNEWKKYESTVSSTYIKEETVEVK